MTISGELAEQLSGVRSVGAITGAGISAESGIPTYRGKGGVYDDPEEGERTVDALSSHTLHDDPDRTWQAIAALARHSDGAQPNDGHRALVRIEQGVERFALLTQNVDGLHQLAGSKNVIDIHGTISETRCMGCGELASISGIAALDSAPRCESCGGVRRPNAVLFGEMLPEAKVERLHEAFYVDIPDLVLIIGTSALFPYIAEPVFVGRRANKLTVEVNPEPTVVTPVVEHSIRGGAAQILPAIAEAIL